MEIIAIINSRRNKTTSDTVQIIGNCKKKKTEGSEIKTWK